MTLFAEIAGRPSDRSTVREDVARSLERICATRREALLLAPEYGVGDVTSLFHSFPMINAWGARLERTVTIYEPRLGHPQVVPIVTDVPELTLRAEIRGVLMVGGKAAAARFSATLDPQCRMSVR